MATHRAPTDALNVPKNEARASFVTSDCWARALSCQPATAVTNEDSTTIPAIARRWGEPSTSRKLSRSPCRERWALHGAADGRGPPLPEGAHRPRREQQEGRHEDQEALGPEQPRHGAREHPPERGAERRARAYEPEEAARLAGREHVVREGPHLRGGQHAEDADPDVDDGEDPGPWGAAGHDGQEERHRAEEGEAADQEPVEAEAPPRAHVEGDRHGHEEEEREIREGEERGLEPAEEERVAGHLADEVGRDHQEEIGEEQQPPGQVAALEAEQALEGSGHGERAH